MASWTSRREGAAEAGEWVQPHRSGMARQVWQSFAAGPLRVWEGGMVRLPTERPADAPFMPEFPDCFMQGSPPDWMAALIGRLDEALPDRGTILAALDPDSFAIDSLSPAFRMPQSPSARDAGSCLAAARVLLACRDDILSPAFVTDELGCLWIEQASWLALMLGGEEAFLVALSELGDPDSFASAGGTGGHPEAIEFGESAE